MNETVGSQLRAAREARGWSVDDIASRLKVPARYVSALEAGDSASLPEATFVRGYVKAYAKAVALDADALAALLNPIEVRAPRPLIGPEGQAGVSRRTTAQVRAPSFRSGSSRRLQVMAGVAVVVGVTWLAWPDANGPAPAVTPQPVVPVASAPAPAAAVPTVSTAAPPAAGGGVTLEVPLPGAAASAPVAQPVANPAVASTAQSSAPATAVPAVRPATPGATGTAPLPPAPAAKPVSAPATTAAPVAAAPPRGLHARFTGTSWVEVRDADNVVIHTRIAMAGNELNVDGKPPLTVTLGDAAAAELWYNGDRVAADKFSSNGIARIIVGQTPR